MGFGIAAYGVTSGQTRKILEAGRAYFERIGLEITHATTPRLLERGDHPGDFEVHDIGLEDLTSNVSKGHIEAFALFHEDENHKPWRAAFHQNINDFGSFPYISAQFADPGETAKEILADFLSFLAEMLDFRYAILYPSDKTSSAWNYATGSGITKVDINENVFLFAREIPELRGGEGRYNGRMLRIVYPLNVINKEHCEISIDGKTLKEWVQESTELGQISHLSRDLFLWDVPDDRLANTNAWLRNAGKLISWQAQSKRSPRRLP
ncbi:hypothetical protein ACJ5NV_06640 [Loktanella agnita]|uniref:hypothetical protein n=1 Tax=Loktanella agnita TaxID=287097 RepID=UPI003987CAA2